MTVNIKTINLEQYARMLKDYPIVQAPMQIGGYVYFVIQGDSSDDVYRVAVS